MKPVVMMFVLLCVSTIACGQDKDAPQDANEAASKLTSQPATRAARQLPREPRLPETIPPEVDQNLPSLWIVGDSTVKNGQPPLYGWGEVLHHKFNLDKINVINKAIGGRSSRTFYAEPVREKDGSYTWFHRWEEIHKQLKPGDFVLVQLGANDNGAPDDAKRPRSALPGVGDETKEIIHPASKSPETVHTFGWYLKQYCKEAKEKGATPILISLIPRADEPHPDTYPRKGHAAFTGMVAESEKVLFIDLNAIVHKKWADAGLSTKEIFEKYYPGDHTHTNINGAKFNADCIVEGIKANPDCELNKYLK